MGPVEVARACRRIDNDDLHPWLENRGGGAPSPLDALDFDAPLRHRDDSMLAKIDAMLL